MAKIGPEPTAQEIMMCALHNVEVERWERNNPSPENFTSPEQFKEKEESEIMFGLSGKYHYEVFRQALNAVLYKHDDFRVKVNPSGHLEGITPAEQKKLIENIVENPKIYEELKVAYNHALQMAIMHAALKKEICGS